MKITGKDPEIMIVDEVKEDKKPSTNFSNTSGVACFFISL